MALLYKKGFRINYKPSVPWSEVITKELKHATRDFYFWMTNGFRIGTVVAYPDFPSKRTTIYKIIKSRKMRLTNKLVSNPICVIYFEDSTFGSSEQLRKKYPSLRILNERCTDISKKYVDQLHQTVFGYNTIVDPTMHFGWVVKKSDLNAMHDGQLVKCPSERAEPNVVYQMLLNNQVNADVVMDYRVPVIGTSIPLVYKKYKTTAVRFTNEVFNSELCLTEETFSSQEQHLLVQFAQTLGADFCEFDVIRNLDDGKIYIIDVNKTPYGPPAKLPPEDTKKAVSILETAFSKEFL